VSNRGKGAFCDFGARVKVRTGRTQGSALGRELPLRGSPSPLMGPAHHHIDAADAALATHKPRRRRNAPPFRLD